MIPSGLELGSEKKRWTPRPDERYNRPGTMNYRLIRPFVLVLVLVGAVASAGSLGCKQPVDRSPAPEQTPSTDELPPTPAELDETPAPSENEPKPRLPRSGKPKPEESYAVPIDGHPQRGPDTALVTIVEFSDFHCARCRELPEVVSKLERRHGDKIRVVFRPYSAGWNEPSRRAAAAAVAADQQGKFWELREALLADQSMDDVGLIAAAYALGLDIARFNHDRASEATASLLREDQAVATTFGVLFSPAFFINGRWIPASAPLEAVNALIELELAKAEEFLAEHQVEPTALYAEMMKGWRDAADPPPIADSIRRDIATDARPGRGNLSDPQLVLVECANFNCPFSKRGRKTVDEVFASESYGDKLAFYFLHFPRSPNPDDESPHRAAIAAGYQGKFFEMHDMLFSEGANELERVDRDEAAYRALALRLDLDPDQLIADWSSERVAQKVRDDIALCLELGATGTPTFFINGRMIRGSVPTDYLKEVFDEELAGVCVAPERLPRRQQAMTE